ncbi:MAG: hypothetical protein PHS14_07995 [Elusimicrobia bacterium]|nr:hypothetical protein [Elusimicrobiota bacterium]
MEGVSIVPIVATASISTAVGLIAAALWGVLRKKAVAHVKISSPEQRELKRLGGAVRRHSFLIEAGAERQALHVRAIIDLIDGMISGDKEKAASALAIIRASETQYLAALQARIVHDEPVADTDEEAS